ncbi:BFD domain protein (2Fe-2S)-binding domain protein [Catenulispora acidiphila DSM 44928]|uniref:BFD domain protein (2Fe-2S)-binding domain protein n=1 Tax=Catenulispora acidiphila (strain DSM 44928 / JCM 14897 / NBRC 102108 / NRRL B-24433 / ID139908) TaxID=479433 RepID=C7QF17_CATAD|nr:NAD(P)/FAD-dependent oxidoreductase [Catenulispora acidiphila]ACU74775.1 BFD domain protein (2Fe-2S)-binding domain protein [Catenulispora acidiphila DSM 44928]
MTERALDPTATSEVFGDTEHLDAFDLAVIGAGPAGMAAAATAAEQGLRVALIDAGRQLGGQYFRHPAPGLTADWLPKLYHGWQQFEQLLTRVETAAGIEVLFGHQVWAIEPGFRVLTDRGPIEAPYVILATGAYERVVPFPGWDLPGVFTAGGAQALLKGNLVLPGRRVVVAGTGPLLLPVAAGLATAGAQVLGLYEANTIRGYAKNPLPLLTNPTKLAEGLDYARHLTRARIPVHTGRMIIEAQGTETLEAVITARPDGTDPHRIECDTLAIGYGLAPQIDLALTLGATPTHLTDGTTALRVNTTQRTTIPNLYAAGETAGVAGVETALLEGEIAGLAVAQATARARRMASRAAGTTETQSPVSASLPPPTPPADKTTTPRTTRTITAARARLTRRSNNDTIPKPAPTEPNPASRALENIRARLTHRTDPGPSPSPASPAATNSEPVAARADAASSPVPNSPTATSTSKITAARARLTRRTLVPAASDPAESPAATTPPNLPTLLRRRTRQRALADLLRARHPIPAAWREHLAADTVVCRCEEVPASAITEAVADLGAGDARTVKLLTRAGMGWCQGRVCGYAVACLARGEGADADPPTEADLLAAAKRPLARPVPLGVLADQDRRNK